MSHGGQYQKSAGLGCGGLPLCSQCPVGQVWGRGKQLALGTELCWLLNNCGDYKWLEWPALPCKCASWVGLECGQPQKEGQDAKVPRQEGSSAGNGL